MIQRTLSADKAPLLELELGLQEPTPAADAIPLTAAECPAVLAGLRDRALAARDVHQRIIAAVSNKRLWQTAEWKQHRERLLKSSCEQCGSADGRFTLQHLWHPPTITEHADALRTYHKEAAWKQFAAEHAEHPDAQDRYVPDAEPRSGCPKCGGYSLQERKSAKALATMPRFRCLTIRQGRPCHHECAETVLVQPIKLQDGHSRLWPVFKAAYEPIFHATKDAIFLEATLRGVENFTAYMSGEGTQTFCRGCAYKWDKKNLRLCVECREAWHNHRHPRCLACATGATWRTCDTCGKRRLSTEPDCHSCFAYEMDAIE
jgi:hypothetical protein